MAGTLSLFFVRSGKFYGLVWWSSFAIYQFLFFLQTKEQVVDLLVVYW